MKQWYEALFENYANKYEKENFAQGTIGEVDFIEAELISRFGNDKSCKILDIGCGTGRHASELAKRGYTVLGVDLSENMLAKGRANSKLNGVEVEFVCADARELNYKNEFDLVIMVCKGAFPLMETDEMNYKILQNASRALKPNGKFIFTTLNGLYPLFHSVKDFVDNNLVEGKVSDQTFDLMTFRDHSTFEMEDDDGNKKVLTCNERYYIPSEIKWLLKSLNFKQIDIFGCKIG